jgi:hypothetical protein
MTERNVPVKYLLYLGATLAIACLVIVLLFKEIHHAHVLLNEKGVSEYPDIAYDLGLELFKTIFIGICLGVGVEIYLKHLKGDSTKVMFEKSGIAKIYPARQDATSRFQQLVDDKRVKTVYIAGISLREFLSEQGSMRPVWEAIQQRLSKEENTIEKNKLPDKLRFNVHLLMLDPRSSEGYFRYRVEKPHSKDDPKDITDGLNEINQVQRNIYNNKDQDFLQYELYEHCPFSFIFMTDTTAFVEQYYYKKKSKGVSFPLVEYSHDSPHFNELQKSVEIVWENAYKELPSVGTAVPLKRAGIKNIFRVDKRGEQARRQIECIKETKAGTVDILSITGRHYVNDPDAIFALREAALRKGVRVRFALLNPVSQQAIFRAIADASVTDKVRTIIANYDWAHHKHSRLYQRVHYSIGEIQNWKEEGLAIDLRLFSCSSGSALLLTSNSSYAGKYGYVRSKRLHVQAVLQS